jgi:hypothetical protein
MDDTPPELEPLPLNLRFCASCDRRSYACKQCDSIRYCSLACQQDDWKIHKSLCRETQLYPLNSAPMEHHKIAIYLPESGSGPRFFFLKMRSIDPIPNLSGYPPLKVWDTIIQDVMLGQQCQPIVFMAHSNDKITRLIGEEDNSLKALNVDVARPWRGSLSYFSMDLDDISILEIGV